MLLSRAEHLTTHFDFYFSSMIKVSKYFFHPKRCLETPSSRTLAKPFATYFLVLFVVDPRVSPDADGGEKKVTVTFCFAVREELIIMSFLLTLL